MSKLTLSNYDEVKALLDQWTLGESKEVLFRQITVIEELIKWTSSCSSASTIQSLNNDDLLPDDAVQRLFAVLNKGQQCKVFSSLQGAFSQSEGFYFQKSDLQVFEAVLYRQYANLVKQRFSLVIQIGKNAEKWINERHEALEQQVTDITHQMSVAKRKQGQLEAMRPVTSTITEDLGKIAAELVKYDASLARLREEIKRLQTAKDEAAPCAPDKKAFEATWFPKNTTPTLKTLQSANREIDELIRAYSLLNGFKSINELRELVSPTSRSISKAAKRMANAVVGGMFYGKVLERHITCDVPEWVKRLSGKLYKVPEEADTIEVTDEVQPVGDILKTLTYVSLRKSADCRHVESMVTASDYGGIHPVILEQSRDHAKVTNHTPKSVMAQLTPTERSQLAMDQAKMLLSNVKRGDKWVIIKIADLDMAIRVHAAIVYLQNRLGLRPLRIQNRCRQIDSSHFSGFFQREMGWAKSCLNNGDKTFLDHYVTRDIEQFQADFNEVRAARLEAKGPNQVFYREEGDTPSLGGS